MTTGRAALLGLLAAAVAIAALEVPLRRRQAELDRLKAQQDTELARLVPVRKQVDDYQRRRDRLDQQIAWVERERSKRRCPWPLPGLDLLAASGARIDGLVLEGSSLVLAGAVPTLEAKERLEEVVRKAPWAREVQAGLAGPPPASAFGLFAHVEAPRCLPAEAAE